ncbi:MAG: endonuclease III domain-containing protein [Aggregatilineales bacterium]
MNDQLRVKAMTVYERLTALHGLRPLVPRREPMHELISTILSHRTTGANEDRAYRAMWDRFGSWQAIRDAPLDALIEAIAPSNFAEVKAPYIKGTVARIFELRGESSLEFLRDMPTDEALEWLMALPGVGIKTASLVLLFCFSKPVLPVDTHVHRVSQRVGLIGPKVDPTAAHKVLLELLPADPYVLFNFHIACLRHGQKICIWGTPRCAKCPLTDSCDWYQRNVRSTTSAAGPNG